jgi:hypothetical protein
VIRLGWGRRKVADSVPADTAPAVVVMMVVFDNFGPEDTDLEEVRMVLQYLIVQAVSYSTRPARHSHRNSIRVFLR